MNRQISAEEIKENTVYKLAILFTMRLLRRVWLSEIDTPLIKRNRQQRIHSFNVDFCYIYASNVFKELCFEEKVYTDAQREYVIIFSAVTLCNIMSSKNAIEILTDAFSKGKTPESFIEKMCSKLIIYDSEYTKFYGGIQVEIPKE